MRKLSKKISMLMVLAMLVSLFSGVVSASAASVWSFYNKTAGEIVEVKETIEMEKGEFADFDLYKEGKVVTKDTYTVVYASSDEDVVWVDAKNGKLRADKFEKAEAGDKATISATFTNVATGKSATRSFVIVIAADEEVEYAIVSDIADEVYLTGEKYALEAVVTANGEATDSAVVFTLDGAEIKEFAPTKVGEYIIVATATVDGEEISQNFVVVVEEVLPEIVEAKQTSLNTVVVTLNNAEWAKDFASKVKYSFVANGLDIDDIIKSAVAKDDTVTITLYSNLVADTTYKFAYTGYDCVATVVGAKPIPAKIEVVGGQAVVGTETALDIKVYTAEGVDISAAAGIKNPVSYAGVDETISIVAGNNIYFFEAGKNAVVNATYDMGWDDNGNEIADLKASGVYYSVAAFTDSKLDGYAADDVGKDESKLVYASGITISLSDTKSIYAKYTRTPAPNTGNPTPVYVLPNSGYKYYSTNENVLMVGETSGELVPCTQGVASVYIKDAQDAVVGSVTVTVKEARKLSSFAPSLSDRMLSTGVNYTDTITVNVTTKDSLGAAYGATYGYALVNLTGNYTDYVTIVEEKDTNGDKVVDQIVIAPSANAVGKIGNGKVQVVTLKITAFDVKDGNNKKESTVTFNIKNMNTVNVATTVLDLSATSVDMKLNKGGVGDYNATAKLVKKDAAGYDLGLEAFEYITKDAQAVTENGKYSIIIKKNSDTDGQPQNALISSDGSTITFSPVTGETPVTKTEKATYTIKVYKGNNGKAQLYATRTISFTDSTSAITVVVNDNTVSATAAGALDFYRDGVKITGKITSVVPTDVTPTVNGKVYVKSVTVTVLNEEMNGSFKGNHTEVVAVNALFGN